jgi:immune inhibitor A
MRSKILGVIAAMLIALTIVTPVLAAPSQPDNPEPIQRGDIIDIGPVLRAKDLPIVGFPDISDAELSRSLEIQATQAYTVGDELTWLALDNYQGGYFLTTYTVVTITEHAEVWVQNDLKYYNLDGTLNTIHPDASDPEYVTTERMNYLANAFDDIIYPTDTSFFGANDDMDGSAGYESYLGIQELDADDGTRVVILVSNVRDLNFYDPVASGSYIAGFFSPTYEFYSGRNMITIDSKQWHRRVGGGVDRPYLYDSTLAHEFQHLIHSDHSPNEDVWPNEGMSGFAEFLNGYWFTGDLGDRTQWQTWPENSLVLWGDQNSDQGGSEILADYQMVNAFMLYTTGRIGAVYTDTAKITQESADGILGFNKWLSDTAATNPDAEGLTFEDLFNDFRLDMLYGGDTDGAQPKANWNADFVSGYESPLEKSGGPATANAYLGLLRDNLDREGYDWPGVPPFGTDFVEVCWSEVLSTTTYPVTFDGDEKPASTAWKPITATEIYTPSGNVTGKVLKSGHTDLTDNFLVFGPVLVTDTDTLTFDHYYNIEDEWDYGFVQVTTDTIGGTGWTSLDMTGMITATDPHAHPVIDNNVPGFSGFSEGWITATYDIGADYSGKTVLLAFRYSTDWGSDGSVTDYLSGWAVDNVTIGDTALTTGTLSTARSIQEVRDAGNRFAAEFVTWGDGDVITVSNIYTLPLSTAMTGTLDLATLSDSGFDEAGERGVIMISLMQSVFEDLIAGGMVAEYADYSLEGLPPSICTSDVGAYGNTHAGASRVYAGEVVTAEIHADNLGSSPNITTTEPAMFYIGAEVPDGTTYSAATSGAIYTDDLSTVAGAFPAKPGVYWTGLVTRTKDFMATFNTDADLVDGDNITITVHYANDDIAVPDQYFMDEDTVDVISAFSLSGLMADIAPVFPGTNAQFTAKVLNLSHSPKAVQLVADVPTDTNFVGITGATLVATSTAQITATQTISPYGTSGAADVTFKWLLGSTYDFGDKVTSDMILTDLTTGEAFDLSAAADVDASYEIYLPLVVRNY